MGNNVFEVWVPVQSAQITSSNATGDKAIFTIPQKCEVVDARVTVEGTEATACVIAFDRRPLAGSDTGRGAADIGSIALTAANNQGKVFYDLAARGVILDAGDQVVVEVTTASTAAKNFVAGLMLRYLPEVYANQLDMVETA